LEKCNQLTSLPFRG